MFAEILQLDPAGSREELLAMLRRRITVGFEVSDETLARGCAGGNIDPQHLGQRPDLSAIEVITAILTSKASAATIQPDLDSLGSMAVLDIAMEVIQQTRAFEEAVLTRIRLIGEADRFERGGWPGKRPLPTHEKPWFKAGGAAETHALAAMAAVVADYRLPLEERVRLLKWWLVTGEEPAAYREKVEQERRAMLDALATGDIQLYEDDGIAAVNSEHHAGIGLGYHLAPIVVALNLRFQFKGGAPHTKYTIAQFTEGYIDMRAIFAALNEREANARGISNAELHNRWNGSPTIGGSPQGEASMLQMEDVLDTVKAYMLQ